jgi:hypothetical protein
MFTQMRADNIELNNKEAIGFFKQHKIKLKLISSYNPEGNGKIKGGHPPIVQDLAKACDGNFEWWAHVLPLTLLADWMTWCSTTGYAPAELMMGHLPKIPWESDIMSWRTIDWKDRHYYIFGSFAKEKHTFWQPLRSQTFAIAPLRIFTLC